MEEIIHQAQDLLTQITLGYDVEYIRTKYNDEEQIQHMIHSFERALANVLSHGRDEGVFTQLEVEAIKAGFKV